MIALQISPVPSSDIKRHVNVARRHSKAKLRKLKKSIEKFGIVIPLLVDEQRAVIDGNARLEVAVALGLTTVPIISATGLCDADTAALRLALNRLGEETTWDADALRAEFRALLEVGYDLDLTGFDSIEIDSALEIVEAPRGQVEEVPPPAQGQPVARPGDIWLLGKHRLGCGDCLDAVFRESVLAAKQAAVCFADPPYNVPIVGNVTSLGGVHQEFAMGSGEMSDAEFKDFLERSLQAILSCLQDDAVSFVCIDWRGLPLLMNATAPCNLELLNVAVWVKSNPGMGSLYRSQHELIVVLKSKNGRHRNNIELGKHGRSRSNVWNYRGVNVPGPERALLQEHPTVKPTALITDALRDVSKAGDVVLDPFCGSGSTLIAAERTKRLCIGIEIEPRFVDLTIRRWQTETGREATREGDGKTFDEAKAEADALALEGTSELELADE